MEDFEAVFDLALTTFYETIQKEGADLGKYIIREVMLTFVSSISKHDRLFYFLHMIRGVKPNAWHNNNARWRLFIESPQGSRTASTIFPRWLQQGMEESFTSIQKNCPELIMENLEDEEWECWSQSDDCYSNFPVKISPENRLLLVKMLRPDNLSTAISKYCCDELSIESLTPISETLAQHWSKHLKYNALPTLIITTDGSDPGNEIRDLACTENCR